MSERVTIVGGTGALGFGLALRLGRAGLAVTIGSRDAARAEDAAGRAAARLSAADIRGRQNADSVREAEAVFLCVPFRSQSENLHQLEDAWREGQLLVDATVPLAAAVGGRATRTLAVWQGSAAQQAAELVPDGVGVVSALHTVAAGHMRDLEHELDEDVLLCGDARPDKRRAAEVIERIPGLRCVDAGRLEAARIVEPLTALLIGINSRYKTRAGIRVTGLPADGGPLAR
jgi:8-hydroxy-5-deazaflavin:NADPH oxidoreductase